MSAASWAWLALATVGCRSVAVDRGADEGGESPGLSDEGAIDGPAIDASVSDAFASDGAVAASEGGSVSCNPSTCPQGCCSADGTCASAAALSDVDACGYGGGACEACLPGDTCLGGSCGHEQYQCIQSSCAGCCDGHWFCATGVGYACGHGGGLCQTCGSSDGSGVCVARDGGGGVCG